MKMPPPSATMDQPSPMPSKMRPPGAPEPESKPAGEGQKVSPEDAGVVRNNEHCIDCSNYSPESGDCSKVEGYFDAQDSCVNYFDPIGDEEPDADDAGGPPDQDRDDSTG